jgi:hypothetical protein
MLEYIARTLESKYATARTSEFLEEICSTLGSAPELTEPAREALVVFINALAHKMLEHAVEHDGVVDWPFTAASGIMDPLHRIEELAPHGCEAGEITDVIFGPATMTRWLAEHRERYPTSSLQELTTASAKIFQGLMCYVLEWLYIGKPGRLLDLYYNVIFNPAEVRLWQALDVWRRFDEVLGEAAMPCAEPLPSSTEDQLVVGGIVNLAVSGTIRKEYDNPNWRASGVEKWQVVDFTLLDAANQPWQLLALTGDDGECVIMTELRCAETGVLFLTYLTLDGAQWVQPSEDFYTHPIAEHFVLSDDRVDLTALPDVSKWTCWLDPTHRKIAADPRLRARFLEVQRRSASMRT